jgi:pyruvate dehydrogenase E1 component alpha subunit
MTKGLGIRSSVGDGNDPAVVYEKTLDALFRIRAGGGPELLEFSTYRWLEHCGPNYDNDLGYRAGSEYLEWKAKDPIANFESALLGSGILSKDEVVRMELNIDNEVSSAFAFAELSPFPASASAFTDLYHAEPPSVPDVRLQSEAV